MSDNGEVEVEDPSGYQVLPKDVTDEIGTVKLFNKWSYEDVEVRDISLTWVFYLSLSPSLLSAGKVKILLCQIREIDNWARIPPGVGVGRGEWGRNEWNWKCKKKSRASEGRKGCTGVRLEMKANQSHKCPPPVIIFKSATQCTSLTPLAVSPWSASEKLNAP